MKFKEHNKVVYSEYRYCPSENISAGPALDQLLEILILVVSAPSNAFKAFVPSVTNLCLGQVWPAVGNNLSAHPDTTLVLLKLFHR